MGNKTHPKGIRLGYIREWDSKWLNLKEMPALIEEDFKIRKFLKDRLKLAAVSKIGIERTGKYLRVNIYTARPGLVIGKKGADIEGLRNVVEEMTGLKTAVQIIEIKRPEIDAQLVAEGVAMQLEKQVGFRRAMKRSIERAMQGGALGIKIMVAGRLGGAEIARTEWQKEGRVPLQTFRADIDYGTTEARIKMGTIGIKTWIFRKELFQKTDADLMAEVRVIEEKEKEELAKKAEAGLLTPEPVISAEPTVEAEAIEEEVMSKIQAEEDEAKKREGNVE
ncbi:MAG: 30S ribosomal protein S3 [Elusimicrobia bacterium]|nr:30S ribosomal protein S3 [Elusimicrobiota bacterium]